MRRKNRVPLLLAAGLVALLVYWQISGDSSFQVVVNDEQVSGPLAWWYAVSGASLLVLLPLVLLVVFLLFFTGLGLMALLMVLGFGVLSIIFISPGPLWVVLGLLIIYALARKKEE